MKNKKIMQAWQAIEPDSAADARMLEAILARNPSGKLKMKEAYPMKHLNWKRLAPIAACLVMAIAVTAVLGGTGLLGLRVQAVELRSGETVNFSKTNVLLITNQDYGADVVTRDLTAEENTLLFGDLPMASFGSFDASSKELLHVEGKSGNTKVILAAPGIPVTDVVIGVRAETDEDGEMSYVFAQTDWTEEAKGSAGALTFSLTADGNIVLVSAEYFVTKANSRGERNIIYFATLDMDGVTVYIECGGSKKDSDSLKRELADVIDALTQHGAPDLAKVVG